MSEVFNDVVAFCRLFAMFEREQVCCGTVTPAQCVLLQTLRSGSWDVSSLAAQTRVTKGAMTRLVDGLETRGLVERVQSEEDARRFAIRLTQEGEREAKRLAALTEQSIKLILDRIPKRKRSQVIESLGLLRHAAEETRSALPCC
ncbi:MAG: MarR family transcriptional regulator [Myxococcota bacterium]